MKYLVLIGFIAIAWISVDDYSIQRMGVPIDSSIIHTEGVA